MAMIWTEDEIAEANGPQPKQSRSKLDHIIAIGGANLAFLAEIANEIDKRSPNHVAAIFQLPYPVSVGTGWYKLSGLTEGVFPEIKFEVCTITPSGLGKFQLDRLSQSTDEQGIFITQCAALFPVWGVRSQFHDRYLEYADRTHDQNPIIVPQGPSWIGNRPIFLRDYENNFAGRLIREIQPALREFLPTYSILSLREAYLPRKIYAYSAMLAPGRMAFAGDFIPIHQPLFQSLAGMDMPAEVEEHKLFSGLAIRLREVGRFESQILALERLRLKGETALALIGALSLLEWLLDGHIQRQGGTARNLYQATRHNAAAFLTASELVFIDKAREARNLAVHEAPPMRHSITSTNNQNGQEIGMMLSPIDGSEIQSLLRLVFDVFRRVNKLFR